MILSIELHLESLNAEASKVQAAVEALAHLFEEGAKLNASDDDFAGTLTVIGFSPEVSAGLKAAYSETKKELRQLQKSTCFDLPHYVNLDWRLDIEVILCGFAFLIIMLQVASRTVRQQVEPVFLLKLDTADGKGKKSFWSHIFMRLQM